MEATAILIEVGGHAAVVVIGSTARIWRHLKKQGYQFRANWYKHWLHDLGPGPSQKTLYEERAFLERLGVIIN